MKHELTSNTEYSQWLRELKLRVREAQLKAAVRVNTELLLFYWDLGREIVERQHQSQWGDGFLRCLSDDLRAEFPEMKGFSRRNLEFVRRWYLFYSQEFIIAKQAVSQLTTDADSVPEPIGQQPIGQSSGVTGTHSGQQLVAQLTQIPWGHNIAIVSKSQTVEEALFYVSKTIENNWSRTVLTHQIESDLYHRTGKAISNFEATLPAPQSDLARDILKNPYTFDFLALTERHDERDLENALMDHLTRFLLELGAGFAYVGRQYRLDVAGDEFHIDLLFYHLRLHCYVVIELKTVKFLPEFAGKLNFYVAAVDDLVKAAEDNATIGILICKSKNDTVVEYALRNVNQPIGVSEYVLTRELPEQFKSSLPTLEQIEAGLARED